MYYLLGIDQEGKAHIIAKAHEYKTIEFMVGAHRIGSHPNDWKDLKIMKEVFNENQ
jgi:hypothetical protein